MAIELSGVAKVFDRSTRPRLRQMLPSAPDYPLLPLEALCDVDLAVAPGDAVGLIGPNGSGKSTLLKLVAGVIFPTAGTVRCAGTVGSIIELGVGFHPDLTGWENARIGRVLLGDSIEEAEASLEEIAAFAGVGEWMGAPLKHSSLGMQARLAFATTTHRRTDVLVVDEILAVGDRQFQQKCLTRMHAMLAAGTAVVIASHEMPLVASFCRRAVQLRHGRVVDDGPAEAVVERYLRRSATGLRLDPSPEMTIDVFAAPEQISPGEPIRVDATVTVLEPVDEPMVGIDLSLPTLDPDHVVASSLVAVPALAAPGRYHLHGASSAIPLRDARWRVALSLVDAARQRRSVSEARTVVMAHGTTYARAQFDFATMTTVRPAAASGAEDHEAVGRPRGDPSQTVLALHHLTKRYTARPPLRSVADVVRGRHQEGGEVTALDDVDLHVQRGTSVGVIGPNGAGKSTLLRVIAGLTKLDGGRVETTARVVPVLDLGATFERESSGWQNAIAFGVMLGRTEAEMHQRMPDIIEFADTPDLMDAPAKQYSTGTAAKLALAVALHVEWQVLLVDELLAVGDEDFRRRALERITDRCRQGDTVVFVSHDLRVVEQLCSRTIRMEHGRVVADGPSSGVIADYGGVSWAGGTMDSVAPLRLQPLVLERHVVPFGEQLDIEGGFLLERPLPTVRLEVSYRHELGDRSTVADRSLRDRYTLFRATMVDAGHLPATAGAHRFRTTVFANELAGACDVVVSAVDEIDGSVLNESWTRVEFGPKRTEELAGPVVRFTWTTERAD